MIKQSVSVEGESCRMPVWAVHERFEHGSLNISAHAHTNTRARERHEATTTPSSKRIDHKPPAARRHERAFFKRYFSRPCTFISRCVSLDRRAERSRTTTNTPHSCLSLSVALLRLGLFVSRPRAHPKRRPDLKPILNICPHKKINQREKRSHHY